MYMCIVHRHLSSAIALLLGISPSLFKCIHRFVDFVRHTFYNTDFDGHISLSLMNK